MPEHLHMPLHHYLMATHAKIVKENIKPGNEIAVKVLLLSRKNGKQMSNIADRVRGEGYLGIHLVLDFGFGPFFCTMLFAML